MDGWWTREACPWWADLKLTVVDRRTREPIRGFLLAVYGSNRPRWGATPLLLAAHSNAPVSLRLPPGRCQVYLISEVPADDLLGLGLARYLQKQKPALDVRIRQGESHSVTLEADAYALTTVALTVTIRFDDGSPAANILVGARGQARADEARTHTSSDGSYRFSSLHCDQYRVKVLSQPSGWRPPAPRTVQVQPEKDGRVPDLVLIRTRKSVMPGKSPDPR